MRQINIIHDNILLKVLDKIRKIIFTEKFDITKTLIETDDKLPHDITLKNVIILTRYTINVRFYP